MKTASIPSGTAVYVGRPAKPMNPKYVEAITTLVNKIPKVAEAHLPQCYVEKVIDPPAQILAFVVKPNAQLESVVAELNQGIERIFQKGEHLDFLPVKPNDALVDDIRNCRMQIKLADKKPWWKFK